VAGPPSQIVYKAHFLQTYVAKKKMAPMPTPTPQKKTNKPVATPIPVVPIEEPAQLQPAAPRKRPQLRAAPIQTVATVTDDFPALKKAIYPVSKTPNWGAMRSAAEWDRIYPEMHSSDFVEIPVYSLSALQIPLSVLSQNLDKTNIALITTKLFYSTRFFGRYHIDSGEFEGRHPGIDLKLAAGTTVGSIAGGRVHATGTDEFLGNFVMIEHHLPTGEEVISIYGHLERIGTTEGAEVSPGTPIGTVGSTGNSSGPHLHLQIDKKKSPGRHKVYAPDSSVTSDVASQWTIHPIEFIQQW
jgi:murein DD-endopeptidase MepM/ murein hydrolase activator NlpD